MITKHKVLCAGEELGHMNHLELSLLTDYEDFK